MSGADENATEGAASESAFDPEPKPRSAKGRSTRSELSKRAVGAARRVAESKATVPHLYMGRTAVLHDPEAGRTARVVAAIGRAIVLHPALNGAYRDGAIELHSRVNLGITVESPDGPLVPTLADADKKSVVEIETKIEELRDGALDGTLAAPSYSGATFTLTLLPEGADSVLAPVTPGQAAHLAVGRTRSAVVVERDAPAVAEVIDLGLSCDARAVRPPQAAAFLGELAALIGKSAG